MALASASSRPLRLLAMAAVLNSAEAAPAGLATSAIAAPAAAVHLAAVLPVAAIQEVSAAALTVATGTIVPGAKAFLAVAGDEDSPVAPAATISAVGGKKFRLSLLRRGSL